MAEPQGIDNDINSDFSETFEVINEGEIEEMATENEEETLELDKYEGEQGETSTAIISTADAVSDELKPGMSTRHNPDRSTRPKVLGKRDSSYYLERMSITCSKEYHDMEFHKKGHKDDVEITPENFRFFATTKSKRNLYLRGFVYILCRVKKDVSYWRCQIKACRGCTVIKFKENCKNLQWKDVNSTENLMVTNNTNHHFHIHPPYLSFEKMVQLYDDRWDKIKRRVVVRGQKLGRFIREGQPPPNRSSGKRKYNHKEMVRKSTQWKRSNLNQSGGAGGSQSDRQSTLEASASGEVTSALEGVPNHRIGWASTYYEEYYNLDYDAEANTVGLGQEISLEPEEFRFFKTTRCKRLLYIQGFVYSLNRVRQMVTYWCCHQSECCGCAVIKLKPEAPKDFSWQTIQDTRFLTVSKNKNLTLHCHPPFRSFDIMVRFLEDRWKKLRRHVKVGGQRYGRYIPPGEHIPPKTSYKREPFPDKMDDPLAYANILCEVVTTEKEKPVIFADGYLYHQSWLQNPTANEQGEVRLDWRCRNRPCRATLATLSRDNDNYKIVNMNPCHNHAPAETYLEALKQRNEFLEMMRKKREKTQELDGMISLEEDKLEDGDVLPSNFLDDNDLNDSDFSMDGGEEPTMEDTPKEEIIIMENCLTLSGDKFLQDIVNADDGTKILLFVTIKNVDYLSIASTWLMDTVRSSKMPELFTHLFTIRARVRYGDPLPLVYALMTSGSQEAFRSLFIDLKVLASGAKVSLNPIRIITSLEENVIKASKEIFHETQIIAGHYHLTKMVSERVSFILMNINYLNAESLKKTAKKLVAMAFLTPDKIKEVWKELKDKTSADEEPLVNWFQETFVLGPVLKVDGSMNFYSTPTFPPTLWSQEQLLQNNTFSQNPFQALLTDSFKDFHWKWNALMESVDGVNPLIEVLKREQEASEEVIRNRLACQDRHLLGEALSEVLANRPRRRNLDLVNEASLLMELEDPINILTVSEYLPNL